MTFDELHTAVFEALDIAVKENGYDELMTDPAEDVAIDLGTYCAELEGLEIDVLLPHVKAWQAFSKCEL